MKASRAATLALAPAWLILLLAYGFSMVWSVGLSFTASRSLPTADLVGLAQYRRLWLGARWTPSMEHLAIYGAAFLAATLSLGLLLAILMDQKVRAEGVLRAIFLFPSAASFVVTGMVWQWIMNPELGLQAAVRGWGWRGFTFDWANNPRLAVFAVVVASVWQGAGLVMAIFLASLRRIDADIWNATRIDGVPAWKVYLYIIIPMLRPTILTTALLLSLSVVKVYELVLALTRGGPGTASDVPAMFIMDYLFRRQNIALACAGSTVLLASVAAIAGLFLGAQRWLGRDGARG